MKRHLLTLAGGVGAIGFTILILLTGNATIQGQEDTSSPEFTLDTPTMEDMAPAEDISEVPAEPDSLELPDSVSPDTSVERGAIETGPVQKEAIRTIEPHAFGAQETGANEPLERMPARAPLSQATTKPEAEGRILRHPIAVSAGTIQFNNGTLQLEGIEPQSLDRKCGEGASAWPCGVVGRTAFRNFLRARAMTCVVPDTDWQGTVTARCSIGNSDPAKWLAENGWAEASANSAFSKSIETAKARKLGFYGSDPRGKSPETILPDVPADPFEMTPETAQ